MAETIIKTKFEFDIQDAITAVDRYKASIKDAGTTTTTAMAGASNALKNATNETVALDNAEKSHHNSMKNESGLIDVLNQKRREDVREKRALKFVLNETAEAAAIVSIALSQMGLTSDSTGKYIERMKGAAVDGLGAFSGLSFALSAVPGGQVIAVISGITMAMSKLIGETDKAANDAVTNFVNKMKGIVDFDFKGQADKYSKSLETVENKLSDLYQKRITASEAYWNDRSDANKKSLDDVNNEITHLQKKKGILSDFVTKFNEQADIQQAIKGVDEVAAENGDKLKSGKLEQLKADVQILTQKRDAATTEKEILNLTDQIAKKQNQISELTTSSVEKNKKRLEESKKEDEQNNKIINSEIEAAKKIEAIIAETESAYNSAEKNKLLMTASTVSQKLVIERDAALKENEINKQKELSSEKDAFMRSAIEEKYKAKEEQINSDYDNKITDDKKKTHKEALDAITRYELASEEDKNKKLRMEADTLIKAIEKDELMTEKEKADAKLRINQNVQKQIEKNSLDGFKKTYADISKFVKQSASTISDIVTSGARYAREKIENEKQDVLNRYDVEIEAAGNNEEKKKELLAQRKKAEDEYNLKVKQAKTEEWIAERDSKIVMSIIDTASAVVEALPNIPLSIAAGVMGAVQTGIIASQPIPKFHTGGQMFFNAPPSQEMPILIRGQETVRVTTPEQERNNSRGNIVTVHLNFNSPIPHGEWIKKSVEEGLKKTGLTADKYFINNNTGINFA